MDKVEFSGGVITNRSYHYCIAFVFPEDWPLTQLSVVEGRVKNFFWGGSIDYELRAEQLYWCKDLNSTLVAVVGAISSEHKKKLVTLATTLGAIKIFAKEGNYFYSRAGEGKVAWVVDLTEQAISTKRHSYTIKFRDNRGDHHKIVEATCASEAARVIEDQGLIIISLGLLE